MGMLRVIFLVATLSLFVSFPSTVWADSKPPRISYYCWGKGSGSDLFGELKVTSAGFTIDNLASLYNAFAVPTAAGDDGTRQIELYMLAGFGKKARWQKRPPLRICALDAAFSASGGASSSSHTLAELRGGKDLCPLSLEYGKSIVIRIADLTVFEGNQPSSSVCEISFLGLQQ